jgi:hypothetical protein
MAENMVGNFVITRRSKSTAKNELQTKPSILKSIRTRSIAHYLSTIGAIYERNAKLTGFRIIRINNLHHTGHPYDSLICLLVRVIHMVNISTQAGLHKLFKHTLISQFFVVPTSGVSTINRDDTGQSHSVNLLLHSLSRNSLYIDL